MVANYIHFSEVDEQTSIQVLDYFLVNYVGWYRHFTVTDTGANRDYVWISDGEPDRYDNKNPRIIRVQSNGASNQLRFYSYSTFTNDSTFTGEIFDATDSVIPVTTLNNLWVAADKERVLIGLGTNEDISFAPAYMGRLDSLFSPAQDPYPDAVRGTSAQTEDWNETIASIQWFALSPSGTERRYKLTNSDTMILTNRNVRNGEYAAFQQLLYTDATAGEFEIRGYPRGCYQINSAASHQTFVTLASGVYQVFKSHQAATDTDNSAWAFGPLKDPRIANPYIAPEPAPAVDYHYQGFKLDANTYALWRMANADRADLSDETGMHTVTMVSGSTFIKSPLNYALDFNGTNQFLKGKAPIAESIFTGSWTTEISFYPDTVSGTLIECGSNRGSTIADNTLMGITLVAGSNVSVYWDHSPTSRVTATFSGGFIDTGRWNYMAVVRDTYLGAPRISLWHSGFGDHDPVYYGSVTNLATVSGGSRDEWFIGKTPESTAHYNGRIDEIRISNTARNYGELAASLRRVRL